MRKILTFPHPVLRRKAEPVIEIDDEIRALIDDMAESMYGDDGAGLAAPQIGVSKRVIVLDAGFGFRAMINPEIVEVGDATETMDEGCLSLPGIRLDVQRPVHLVVRGKNEESETEEIIVDRLQARVFLHEIDHLNGVLLIDHASSIQRALLRSKLRKLEKIS